MRRVYISYKRLVATAVDQDYIYDDRVSPGNVLVVRNICAWWAGIGTTEEVQFFVANGLGNCYLGEDTPAVIGGRPNWRGQVAIGEGDRVGIYAPDMATGDVASMWVFGELWDIADWRKSKE